MVHLILVENTVMQKTRRLPRVAFVSTKIRFQLTISLPNEFWDSHEVITIPVRVPRILKYQKKVKILLNMRIEIKGTQA
jgi:hypothetical protein